MQPFLHKVYWAVQRDKLIHVHVINPENALCIPVWDTSTSQVHQVFLTIHWYPLGEVRVLVDVLLKDAT